MASAVTAQVRYLNSEWRDRRHSERPRIFSKESRHAHTTRHDVEITDARPLQERGELDLDRSGFMLTPIQSGAHDFHDQDQVKTTYYEEVQTLVRALTGAAHTVPDGHVVRTEDPKNFLRAYARYVHCDYSLTDRRERAVQLLIRSGHPLQAQSEQWDFAWYNVWKPIDVEVQQNPLTLVDATTLDPSDVVEYFPAERENLHLISAMPLHSPEHRFYYFSRMQPDEAIVFKQLDSRVGRSISCPHTAFHDPTTPQPALGRRSIELRILCAFPREATAASI